MCCEARQEELFEKTVAVAFKVFPKKKTAIETMAARYLTKWKQHIDTEMAYTIITGFQRKHSEKEDSSEDSMSEIAVNKEDMLRDLSAEDSDHVKAIVSSYSHVMDDRQESVDRDRDESTIQSVTSDLTQSR